ncbi:MAG: ATPase [Alphaproteobacteria bacterium]|nr:MAG: ATPase [Alphaproteobacteria bacterium]
MKRFYKNVTVAARDGGFAVELDGRAVRTPAKTLLLLPTQALASALAEEWDRQGETVLPAEMPMTRMANTAIDRIGRNTGPVIDEISGYARADHLCYWAEHPRELVERQAQAWLPHLRWVEQRFGAKLQVVEGVMHQDQPEEVLSALHAAVAAFNAFELAALHTLTTITGSLVLALAVADGRLSAEDAFTVSQIDETFQIERWGVDAEAEARRKRLAGEMAAAGRFLICLRQGG